MLTGPDDEGSGEGRRKRCWGKGQAGHWSPLDPGEETAGSTAPRAQGSAPPDSAQFRALIPTTLKLCRAPSWESGEKRTLALGVTELGWEAVSTHSPI